MIAEHYLSAATLPLAPDDTVEQGLSLMETFRVRHLPIVDSDHQLLGIVSEDELLNESDFERPVAYIIRNLPIYIKPATHLYDVAKTLQDHSLTTLPVADENGHFYGIIERKELFDVFSEFLGVQERGAIIVIETNPRDYSPAQIAYILEQNNVKLISLANRNTPEGLHITLKLSTIDTSRVRHVLEHHGYRIIGDFDEAEDDDDLQRRADEFLRYLEV